MLFIDPPIPFDQLAARASWRELFGQRVLVAPIDDLIAMKKLAGRPKDLDDIAGLAGILRSRS